MHAQILSNVQLFVTPWTVACQAPLSIGQECWSWLLFPPPGDLPDQGTEPESLTSPALAGGFLTTSTTWEKEMAAPSSILAWGIPGTEEPGGLLSVGLPRVGHDWSDLACRHALEKEMSTHSSVFAWRIPGTEEPGGLPSVGSHRVGHDWSNLAAAALPGKIRSLDVGKSQDKSHKETDSRVELDQVNC